MLVEIASNAHLVENEIRSSEGMLYMSLIQELLNLVLNINNK